MAFRYIFLFLALIMSVCVLTGVLVKRRNAGFLMTLILVVACDMVCFALIGSSQAGDARVQLVTYYICHAWLYFGVMWTIALMARFRHYKRYLIPAACICTYQTVIMAANLVGVRTINLSRHIMLGMNWWIAESVRSSPVMLSFSVYNILLYANAVLIIIAIIGSIIHSDRLFRMKFYAFITGQLLATAAEYMIIKYALPVWIWCVLVNIVGVICHYFTNYYSDNRLIDWSLKGFANEMSDSFILYNEYDDMLYTNDVLKDTLTEDLIESFAVRANMDKWIDNTITIDSLDVIEYKKDGGDVIYLRAKKNELINEGITLGTIYILHNSTDTILRIRAMEEANAELERVARMKSDFLANMSHEIRTPMNAVIGMAEIALREDMAPQLRSYLSQIRSSGRNLLGIINDILDFSKIEAGRMEIIPDRYEPLSEINDIAGILITRIVDKKLELFVDVDEKLPHALMGDAMRIRQVLINLANNAIKFTNEGIVCIKVICEDIKDDELTLTYHVIDTGIGIKPEDMDRLFNSFEQVDSKRNRAVEGTGLGLAISKRLCEAMGGTLKVRSEYNKGSDFYFSIPQRIVDAARDIRVEDAGNKCAFVVNDRKDMIGKFIEEMDKLKVESRWIGKISDYVPTGKRDYVFAEKAEYDKMCGLLKEYPDCTGVILTEFDDMMTPDVPNLKIMRKPETTPAMLMILNDKESVNYMSDEDTSYSMDFKAPDARILIVDDNAINLTIAEGLLEPLEVKCTGVLSGREALDILKKESFDLILMDHMMPEMDGVETAHIIRKSMDNARDIPIVALTANVAEGVREMFIKEGMNDFVGKPIDVKELVTVVRRLLPDDKIIYAGNTGDRGSASDSVKQSMTTDITEYDCLDYKSAIEAMGNVKLYNKVVEEYYTSGASKLEAIRKAYGDNDIKDYVIKVHALKSSSRQIGAKALADAAERLERAGKDNDTDVITRDTDRLLRDYAALLESLGRYFKKRKKILVIDDDTVMLKLIKGYLEDAYDVASAKSAAIAYRYLEKRSADVILLDYQMPDESGDEVFSHLKNISDETRKIPIVFLTGNEDNEITARMLKLKPDGYMSKPVRQKDLVDMIMRFTGQ